MILWEIAVRGYFPPWMLGNKFQRWWYHTIGSLQGWLLDRLEINIRKCEKELDITKSPDNIDPTQNED